MSYWAILDAIEIRIKYLRGNIERRGTISKIPAWKMELKYMEKLYQTVKQAGLFEDLEMIR